MTRPAALALITLALAACEQAPPPGLPAREVAATAETARVAGSGDAADDPAVWAAPDPADSLVLGTDKTAGLYAFNLDGSIAQRLPVGRLNNVDVRGGFMAGDREMAIVAASDRTNIAIAYFLIDPATREIAPAGRTPLDLVDPYGACLYVSPVDGSHYAFVNDQESTDMVQLRLSWDGAGVTGEPVRRFTIGTQPEGCVADDRTGELYVGEEAVGVWRYGAEPGDGEARTLFAEADGDRIVPDVEGLAIWPQGETGGYLFASSQGDSAYAVYELETGAYVERFRIADGTVDATTETDGIEVFAGDLGPAFPQGVFVAQDDADDSGGQNFKIVDLADIAPLLDPAE
ncbi:phytase [Marinicauda algicola]|uniref:Phytase n=1 Tax=Marinicauda algicola TaxID=2029849 RepID=A0A4S2H3E3_9PROT|nr:phytase [Marinicauda algicola]TGY90135.1 phytase [Marinicauda algicola]